MSTERQQEASRANGSKSRGPITPEGKLASSRNAITHGMLSAANVLKGESTDRFLSLLAGLCEEFQPQTPFEESLVENMAVARWRQLRIWGLEKASLDCEMHRQAELPGSLSSSISTEDNATRAARAFRRLSDDSHSLELIHRYDSRYERQYYRAHRRFLEVRGLRNPPPPTQPEPFSGQGLPPTGGASQIREVPPAESVISKGTPEIVANKAAQAQVRCAADTSKAAQAQVRCAADTSKASQTRVRCAAGYSKRRHFRYRRSKMPSIRFHPASSVASTDSSGLFRTSSQAIIGIAGNS